MSLRVPVFRHAAADRLEDRLKLAKLYQQPAFRVPLSPGVLARCGEGHLGSDFIELDRSTVVRSSIGRIGQRAAAGLLIFTVLTMASARFL
jgi:hypothetical protein